MSTRMSWIRVMIGCLLLVLMTSCGTAAQETPTAEPTAIPTDTSIPPTAGPEPIVITFDGNECTVTGPTEIPTGNYPFVWNDLSEEQNSDFWVCRLLEGKTYQDVLDLQSEPGEYFPKESWWVHPPGYYSTTADVWIFIFDEAGDYFIFEATKHNAWMCAPFTVIEAPSE